MRHFAIEDRVYLFDFAEERKSARYTPPRPNVNNATVFRGFYTDKLEDNLAQRFESGIDTLLGKVTEEQQLTLEERKMLSRYLYAYMLRSPWMLNRLQYRYEPDMRHIIKEMGDSLSFVYAALYDTDHRIGSVPLEEVKGILSRNERELSDVGKVQSSLRALFSEGSLLAQSPTHFDALVASLPWRVFISTNQPFVLGDFFFQVNGPDQPVFELYCPISSTHCLLISRYAPEPTHATENIEYLNVQEQTVRAINVRTAVSSVRYVISGRDLSWVARACKTPPRNHLNLKVPNMQTDQLVGGYISSRCPNCWWALSVGEVVEREMGGNKRRSSRAKHLHAKSMFQPKLRIYHRIPIEVRRCESPIRHRGCCHSPKTSVCRSRHTANGRNGVSAP